MKATPVLAVAFDYGRVLSGPQDVSQVERMRSLVGAPTEEFEARYRVDRLAYDRGTLASADYWAAVLHAANTPATASLVEQLIDADANSWGGTDERVIDWARRIAARGTKLAILSNMPGDILRVLAAKHETWLRNFPLRVFSCDIGCVKPDAMIYEVLLDKLGLQPAQVLFIDDHAGNIEGARRVGLQTIHFTTYDALANEPLAELGLPPAD